MSTKEFPISRLAEFGIDPNVIDRYNEPHRFYHNWDHIEDLLVQMESLPDFYSQFNKDILFLAAIFHDIVYDPRASDNESASAALFKSMTNHLVGKKDELRNKVVEIIMDTKDHLPNEIISSTFCQMDLNILTRPLDELIAYENKIFKEFQFVDWKVYRGKRVEILNKLKCSNFNILGGEFKNLINKPAIDNLITYIQTRKPSIGVYAGSFNPFHVGHYNILQKAEKIFDKVIIAQGVNTDKLKSIKMPSDPKTEFPTLPNAIQFRQIERYDGLLTDFIKGLGYDITVIRGLRNGTDLQYEMNQYRFLQDLKPDIKIVSLFCDKEFEHVSSSAIRQLKPFGKHHRYLLQ